MATQPGFDHADRGVSDDDYRALMRTFPSGVAVVTTIDAETGPYGATCTSLSSVTLNPPTLLVCLDIRSRTLQALREFGGFAVNLLHARGRRAAEVFSSPVPDRFANVPWRPAGRLGQPWLFEHAFAIAECEFAGLQIVGDRAVVFGQVGSITQTDDVPLMYGFRRFASWPEPHRHLAERSTSWLRQVTSSDS